MKLLLPFIALIFSGCVAYNAPGVHDASPLIAALETGRISEGTNIRDTLVLRLFTKPAYSYKFGDLSKTRYFELYPKIAKSGEEARNQVYEELKAERFLYQRFETKRYNFSVFIHEFRVFSAYRWDRRDRKGRYYFKDQKLMDEYLSNLEKAIDGDNPPISHVVPEELE